MTKLRRRIGALALALSMSLSMILSNVPALAAEEETTYTLPQLVMDFLGDNKPANSYNDGTQPGIGGLPTPANHDMARQATEPADGSKWDGYVSGDQGDGNQTIFWIGIGIKDIDRFILSNGRKGIYSAELGLYYNPDYVEPYVPADGNFKSVIEQYNLGTDSNNQWSTNYRVVQALTNQEPLNDPIDNYPLGDYTPPDSGYGTQEFYAGESPDGAWDKARMVYVSFEMDEGNARFRGASHNADTTYYIAMIPFVLKDYDPDNHLCIRLARNASVFSIGSAGQDSEGTGIGSYRYGNWDKYTYHDPEHDLKLMFDYTGDLNIFKNTRVADDHYAQLEVIDNTANPNNTARMIINNEPFYPPPSQLATQTGDQSVVNVLDRRITGLSGGTELRVNAHADTGYTAYITIETSNGSNPPTITTITVPETGWTDEWTFIMPTGINVTVTIEFRGTATLDTEYNLTLDVVDPYNETDNWAQLTTTAGQATSQLGNGTETITATYQTTVTVTVNRHSDYDVVVTRYDNGSLTGTELTAVFTGITSLTYTFTMPSTSVRIEVKYELAPKYKATLAVNQADIAANNAKLSYTDSQGYHESGVVSGVNANNGYNPATGLQYNQIETRSGMTVTVDTACDPAYRVKQVRVYRNGQPTQTIPVTQDTFNSNLYTFTMPAYDVDVIVEYEKIQTYRVELVVNGATATESATLYGLDARFTAPGQSVTCSDNSLTLLSTDGMWVFAGAQMTVIVNDSAEAGGGLAAGRTATISVDYPIHETDTQDVINATGSAASGFNFNMVAMDHPGDESTATIIDKVVVTITFGETEKERLYASIEDDKAALSSNASNTYALWSGLGHANTIGVYEGDQLSTTITVAPGHYIASVQIYEDIGNPPTNPMKGAPLGVPVTLSGIGYNNGNGGTETAVFDMPSVNAIICIVYGEGEPPVEPKFTATIRKDGTGDGNISITNTNTGLTDTNVSTNGKAKWVAAQAGDQITATFTPDSNSYVSGVTVTADVPGTTINWHYNDDGSISVTMPAANVVITVTFEKIPDDPDDQLELTVAKDPENNANTVEATSSTGSTNTVVTTPVTVTPVYANEQILLDIYVAPGFYIDKIEVTPTTVGSTMVPFLVTPSSNGYNGGAGGNVTAVFNMPAEDATVTVYFLDGTVDPPRNTITLEVTGTPGVTGNTAELFLNGVTTIGPLNSDDSPVTEPASEGSVVEVKITTVPGYSVDIPIVTTPSGLVSITWIDPDTFTFIMPSEPLTVTVNFRRGDPTDFYVNLIFRAGDPAGVAAAKGTLSDYTDLDNNNLIYSRRAVPGENVIYSVLIPNGYYISDISVTPADFNVTTYISGMIGKQQGSLTMPEGNININITIKAGWPDDVLYPVKLHVTAPNDGVNDSTASLTNTNTASATGVKTTGKIPASGVTSQSASILALDGEKMLVVLYPASTHVLNNFEVVDGAGEPVSYQWTTYTDGNQTYLAAEFSVPGSSVDVYVDYILASEDDTPNDYTVTLHLDPAARQGVTLTNTVSSASATTNLGSFNANTGDRITLTVTGDNALITAAYALTGDGITMVNLNPVGSAPTLVGSFVDDVSLETYEFVMPFHTNVDVYLVFKSDVTPPGENQHTLSLMVTGPNGSGTVLVSEPAVAGNTMSATAVGSNSMVVNDGNDITAKVTPNSGYALYSLIAYTAHGERVVVSLDSANVSGLWDTYIFTMPADTTYIEAEFRAVEERAYQIQVIVNNTVNGGLGNNDANLYYPVGDTGAGFKFRDNVSAGTVFDLGLLVESGYQVESIIAVPQGSGVMANIPIPVTTTQRTQVRMPASNLVIYVTFRLDTTTRYTVVGEINYLNGITAPTTGSNDLTLDGKGSLETDTFSSTFTNPTGYAIIHEAQGEWVEASWVCAPGYVVSHYTVTTASGQVVLSDPLTPTSIRFVMPNEMTWVRVYFTTVDDENRKQFKATLHYVNSVTGDEASITEAGDPTNTINVDTGVIPLDGKDLFAGDQVDIKAIPGSGRWLQTIYVLQNGPTLDQTGQMLPFIPTPTIDITTQGDGTSVLGDASFYMPSGDVDVYVVFSATQPDPTQHMAVLKVNCDNTTAGAHDQTNNYATMSVSSGASVTAYSNDVPASMLVTQNSTVTVTITIDNDHELVSVVGTPIALHLEPQVNPLDPLVYTFVMPTSDTSIIVNLREKTKTKYTLNLWQSHSISGPNDADNKSTVSYNGGSITTVGTSDFATMGVPATEEVTLTVEPTQGYFVRAAYAVYSYGLVQLTPIQPKRTDSQRSDVGLEGATYVDCDPSNITEAASNTATFEMPAGTTDVYVVYEYGDVPEVPWYNLVVIATDTGGTTPNSGLNKVLMSSENPVGQQGVIDAADPTSEVPSTGVATYFYSVPVGEHITVDAATLVSQNPAYQYDYMVSTVQTGVTPPTPWFSNAAGHPLGDVQEFDMIESNVGVHVNFKTTGTTDLNAYLHVVRASNDVPGYSDNTVTLSVGTGADYRSVDNSQVPAANLDGSLADGTFPVLTDLISTELITAKVDPKDPNTRVVQVVVTTVDAAGNVIGSVFATQPNSNVDEYTHIMGDHDVHVYVVLAKDDDPDRFIAMATPVYDTGVGPATPTGPNVIDDVINTTTSGLNSAPHWTEVRGGDQVRVDFEAEAGVYVYVTAMRADTYAPLAVAQFGVGNGSINPGSAYVDVPDPGCDVIIEVFFSTTPPEAQDLTFISTGHDDEPNNEARLKIDRTAPPRDQSTLTPPNQITPKADLQDDFNATSGPGGTDEKVTPGTNLTVNATVADGYEVKKVEITVTTPGTTPASGVTVTYYMTDLDNDNVLDLVDGTLTAVNLQMPLGTTTIKMYFAEAVDVLQPDDPENTGSDKDYEDHWIRAENRGDYLIVTVPTLNSHPGDTNRASVVWDEGVKEDNFKFYLWDNSQTDPYIDLSAVIKMSRPADAAPTTGTEPYELGVFYTDTGTNTDYYGARFILEVKTDQEIDDDNEILAADKADAKDLAAKLRKIMDNEGTNTKGTDYNLYITCVETTYTDSVADLPKESEKVDFEVPRYYSLVGQLESYAPTHTAYFTLTTAADGNTEITFTAELKEESGSGFWQQDFKIKLTSEFDELLKDKEFTLTIEKSSHVTYTHTKIELDPSTAEATGNYDTNTLEFSFSNSIRLFCGDIDNNGGVKMRDLDLLMGVLYGDYPWNTDKEGDPDWAISVFNPESIGYAADLDGNGKVAVRDMDIMMDDFNFNRTTKDYGNPEGLTGGPTYQTLNIQMPLWAMGLLETGATIPDWVMDLIEAGETIPDWVVELLVAGETIPNWAVELLTAGKTIPAWAVELILAGEELPDWAMDLLAAGEPLPEEPPVQEEPIPEIEVPMLPEPLPVMPVPEEPPVQEEEPIPEAEPPMLPEPLPVIPVPEEPPIQEEPVPEVEIPVLPEPVPETPVPEVPQVSEKVFETEKQEPEYFPAEQVTPLPEELPVQEETPIPEVQTPIHPSLAETIPTEQVVTPAAVEADWEEQEAAEPIAMADPKVTTNTATRIVPTAKTESIPTYSTKEATISVVKIPDSSPLPLEAMPSHVTEPWVPDVSLKILEEDLHKIFP